MSGPGAIQQADSFKDALRNVALQLPNMGLQGALGAGPLGSVLGPMANNAYGSLFRSDTGAPITQATATLPAMATGGTLRAGEAAMVGERGPEAFVAAAPGRVLSVPQAQAALAGGRGSGMTIHVDARNATDLAAVRAAAEMGAREALAREPAVNRDMRRRGQLWASLRFDTARRGDRRSDFRLLSLRRPSACLPIAS